MISHNDALVGETCVCLLPLPHYDDFFPSSIAQYMYLYYLSGRTVQDISLTHHDLPLIYPISHHKFSGQLQLEIAIASHAHEKTKAV